MALAKIKEAHKTTVVAFGSSGLPLGLRDDIDDLAIIAHESQDPYIISLFEKLPSLQELKKSKVEAQLKRPAAINEDQEKSDKKPATEK